MVSRVADDSGEVAAIDGTGLGEMRTDVLLNTGAAFAGRPTTQVATSASRHTTRATARRHFSGSIQVLTSCCLLPLTLNLLLHRPSRVAGQPGDHHVLALRPFTGAAEDDTFDNDSSRQNENSDRELHLSPLSQASHRR